MSVQSRNVLGSKVSTATNRDNQARFARVMLSLNMFGSDEATSERSETIMKRPSRLKPLKDQKQKIVKNMQSLE